MNYEAEQYELKKLFDYYMGLARRRVYWAQSWIADAYFWGWGVEKNYNQFIEWDTIAARNGSSTSARRMLLYYHSIGSYDAAATLVNPSNYGLFKNTPIANYDRKTTMPNYITTQSIYFRNDTLDRIIPDEWTSFNDNEYQSLFAGKDVFSMINAYENGFKDELLDDKVYYREVRRGGAALLKAICYIYGFGVDQDYNKAMNLLLEFDRGSDYIENTRFNSFEEFKSHFYFYNHDFYHYYCCLYESGIPGDEGFESGLYDFSENEYSYSVASFDEGISAAYRIRHDIRWALQGNTCAAAAIGINLLEDENKFDNAGRRIIYHDDKCALSYLKLVAGAVPDSWVAYKALELSSNPDKKTFDKKYADKLCSIIECKLDEGNCSRIDRWMLVDAYVNLARSTDDIAVKKQYGEKGLIQCSQDQTCRLGRIYDECFSDYEKALEYYLKWDSSDRNEYARKCREKLSGKTSTTGVSNNQKVVSQSANTTTINSSPGQAPGNYVPVNSNYQHTTSQYSYNSNTGSGSNGLAIAALITGILSVIGCFPCSMAAIVLGIIGLVKGDRSGLNIAGLVLGGLSLIGSSIFLLFVLTH